MPLMNQLSQSHNIIKKKFYTKWDVSSDDVGLDEMGMGRHQGDVGGGTFFRSPKTGIYVISCMIFCRIIADLRRGVYYQKCYDPECRRIDFRSSGTYCPC